MGTKEKTFSLKSDLVGFWAVASCSALTKVIGCYQNVLQTFHSRLSNAWDVLFTSTGLR